MDDSTHLRCYYTPTVSFVLYHCTFPRIYVCTTHFAFTPLDDSTHLRCFCTPNGSSVLYHFYTTLGFYASTFLRLTLLLHDWMILRIYDASVRRLAVFCFTPLYDSTHLRCYCTPTGSFVLYHCTILRIYDATVRRLSVLFYTTVRFYASTFLRLTLHRNSVVNRSPG